MRISFLLFFLSVSITGIGQKMTPERLRIYQQKYPSTQMVILEDIEEVFISLNDGKINIIETSFSKNLYLTKDAGLFREREIGYSSFSSIENLRAITYAPNGKKYKKNTTKDFKISDDMSSSVFHDDSKVISFILQGLQEGAMSELSYTRNIKDPHFLGRAVFQRNFPVEKQIYRIITDPNIEMQFTEHLTRQSFLTFKKYNNNGKVIYEWTGKDAPTILAEKWSPPFNYIIPQVFPRIASYSYNGKSSAVLRNTSDLFKWYESFVDTVNTDRHDPIIQATIDSIVDGSESDLEKVKRVFEWTQENIKYVAYEAGLGGFVPRSAVSVCTNRYGDCKDMSSTMVHLLKYAGVTAHLTWIGTNAIPFTYDQLPTPSVDNHMIATYIDKEGKHYYMDATGRYLDFGTPSSFIQEQEALIRLGTGKFETAKVPMVTPQQNAITDQTQVTIKDGSFVGSATSTFNGYYKQNLQYKLEDATPEEKAKFYKDYLRKGNNKFIPDNFKESHYYPDPEPFKITYNFTIGDYVMENGDEMYVNLNLSDFFSGDKLKAERKYPFTFKFTAQQKESFTFTVPVNYKLDYTPKTIEVNNDLIYYKAYYQIDGNTVTLHTESYKKKIYYEATDVLLWNKSISTILKSQKDVIILKKQ